ncbi:MAG: hypothetical protein ABI383_04330 [Acidobacteriaceae bacterium]
MKRRHSQSGYALLIILLMVTLMAIALAAAVPAIKTQIRREQEIELQHRGNQYVRAIQTYYHKFGRYPNSIDQLVSTNNLRFLRKRYKDPMTGKDDWRIIHMGEAKFPPKIKGAAGQMGQQIGQNIGTSIGSNIGTAPNSPGFAGTAAGGATQSTATPGDSSSAQTAQTGPTGLTGPQPVGGLGLQANNGSGTGSSIGQSGAPIIGIAIPSTHDSLKVYNERKKYNEWEFIYDPRIEALKNAGAAGAVGGGGAGAVNGNAMGVAGGGIGPGANSGSMGMQTPQPVQPQPQNPQ